MAITNVQGTVSRVFYDGRGAEVVERFTVKGKPVEKRWTTWWDEPHGFDIGDDVTVSGLHSDELNEWEKDGETRRSVKRSLSKCRSQATGDSSTSFPAQGGLVDGYDTRGAQNAGQSQLYTNDSEVPF